MRKKKNIVRTMFFATVCFAPGMSTPDIAGAHCGTLDGPVVAAARQALAAKDVTPVLKWVQDEDETEIRTIFQKTLAVRDKGPEARDFADMCFSRPWSVSTVQAKVNRPQRSRHSIVIKK